MVGSRWNRWAGGNIPLACGTGRRNEEVLGGRMVIAVLDTDGREWNVHSHERLVGSGA